MAWILFLLVAIGCFAVACLTKTFALGVACMLLALVCLIASTILFLSARVGTATRNTQIMSSEELRALRAEADARHDRAASSNTQGGGAVSNASAAATQRPSDTQPAPPTSR